MQIKGSVGREESRRRGVSRSSWKASRARAE